MAPGFPQTPEEQCIYYRSVISRRDEKIHTLEARIEELERELGQILPYAESAWDAIQRIKAAVDGDFRYLTRLHALRLERELAAIMDVLIKEADRG
jgi:hypothetical protein